MNKWDEEKLGELLEFVKLRWDRAWTAKEEGDSTLLTSVLNNIIRKLEDCRLPESVETEPKWKVDDRVRPKGSECIGVITKILGEPRFSIEDIVVLSEGHYSYHCSDELEPAPERRKVPAKGIDERR